MTNDATAVPSVQRHRLIRALATHLTPSYVVPVVVCSALGRIFGVRALVDEAFTTIAISSALAATVVVLIMATRAVDPGGSVWRAGPRAAAVAALGCATTAVLVAGGLAAADLLDEGSLFHAGLSAALGGAITAFMSVRERCRELTS